MDKGTYNARKLYYKRWREKNKDKINQYNRRYWERRQLREEMNREEANKDAGTETISEH